MSIKKSYLLATGNADYQRLAILNKMYNPTTIRFMQQVGLSRGMEVLDIGCGTGHMSVELAKIVGPQGKVVALDFKEEQLASAKFTAEQAGVSNIEFKLLDLNTELDQYQQQFDFIYGRWVIEFTQDPVETFKKVFAHLKIGGTFVYESTDISDSGCFGYPDDTMPKLYSEMGVAFWQAGNLPLNFIKQAYFLLQELKAEKLHATTNQPVSSSAESKMPFRLGLLSGKATILQNGILSEESFTQAIADYEKFETAGDLVGFYRNLLVAGKRTV